MTIEQRVDALQDQMNKVAEAIELLTSLVGYFNGEAAETSRRFQQVADILEGMSIAIKDLQGRKE